MRCRRRWWLPRTNGIWDWRAQLESAAVALVERSVWSVFRETGVMEDANPVVNIGILRSGVVGAATSLRCLGTCSSAKLLSC